MGNNQNWPYKEERKGLTSPDSSLDQAMEFLTFFLWGIKKSEIISTETKQYAMFQTNSLADP